MKQMNVFILNSINFIIRNKSYQIWVLKGKINKKTFELKTYIYVPKELAEIVVLQIYVMNAIKIYC